MWEYLQIQMDFIPWNLFLNRDFSWWICIDGCDHGNAVESKCAARMISILIYFYTLYYLDYLSIY